MKNDSLRQAIAREEAQLAELFKDTGLDGFVFGELHDDSDGVSRLTNIKILIRFMCFYRLIEKHRPQV